MDFDAKNREKISSQDLPLFFHENFSRTRNESSIEGSFSSKSTSPLHLQDLHTLDKFNLNGSSSSSTPNPFFSMQTICLDPFDNSTFGYLPNFEFYETKPIETHVGNYSGGRFIPLIDNFNQNGCGFLGHSQMITPINMVSPSSHQNHHNILSYREFGLITRYPPPDEGSSTSPKNDSIMVANNSPSTITMARKEGRGQKKKTNVVKGQWTIEEDRLLIQLVERFGVRKWSHIAQLLNGRIGKQCRERWHNHLKPNIKKDVWSEEEDRILIKAHQEIGNKWAEIAKRLLGRTENSIKNHWNATKRRQFSKRKCRSKYPSQSSLLQEYIKSLDPEIINAGCRKKKPSSSSSSTTHASSNKNNPKSLNNQGGSSSSSSGDRLGHEYDFSEVPDFNFDAQMLEQSSIDSLLDGTHNKDNEIAIGAYDHHQGKGSYESLDDPQIEFAPMVQCGVKKEFDLVDMINQVNL
ncbi:hypothetical protein Cgig2_012728 [Carnegiea gigantea]|uniref:Transcription factor MYB98 n=1 Tax=Carnegiea gigantea TaxID=171969 RepID=A0A9Q1QFJ3_9CARY|nr:hypothetical protein Cgig2_012728 [Carnegiea gigantea]